MNELFKRFFLFLFFIGNLATYGQIVNEGTLSIAENTSIVFVEDFTNTQSGVVSNNGILHLKKNLFNNGGYTFDDVTSNESTTAFSGMVTQSISGSQMLEIPRLQLNNASGFQLATDLMVTETADFTNGIMNNRDFGGELNFEPDVTLLNVNDQSHINGPVLKIGNDVFYFPIGADGFARTIGVDGIANSATLISAAYFPQNSNSDYSHGQKEGSIQFIDDTAYWEIKSLQGSESAIVTLSWNMTTPSQIMNTPEDMQIVHWPTGGTQWTALEGIINANDRTITTASAVAIEGIFALATVTQENDLTDSDNDGLPDVVDPDDNNPDTDGDGIPDGADADVDGDGVLDNGTDRDGDGINDANDTEDNREIPILAAEAFTPNADGVNDTWLIRDIENYPNSLVTVYNRYGHEVFIAKGYANDWDGTYASKNKPLPAGSYYYIISLQNGSEPIDGWMFINY